MPIREFLHDFDLEDALGLDGKVTVVDFLQSRDGSTKIVQAISAGEGHGVNPNLRVTFETGRYFTDGEEKVCISSQIGCGMRCSFCATGELFTYAPGVERRLMRNLTAEEIVTQVDNALLMVPPNRSRKLVYAFMGMGEVGANFKQVDRAIKLFPGLRPYHEQMVTVSTIGSNLRAIKQLQDNAVSGQYGLPVRLHISLHASDDETRRRLMPAAKSIREVLQAAEVFAQATGTEVKLNYVLVDGFNDRDEDANRLIKLLQGRKGLVMKVSRLNPHNDLNPTTDLQTERFISILEQQQIPVYRFHSLGTDVEAGCGEFAKGSRKETILVQVMRTDGKYLILQRAKGKPYEGLWSIPSGRMEAGETVLEATQREMREETGIDITQFFPQYQRPFQYIDTNGTVFIVHPCIVMVGMNAQIDLLGQENPENIEFEWINYADFFDGRPFAPPLNEELERMLKEQTSYWDEYQRIQNSRYSRVFYPQPDYSLSA